MRQSRWSALIIAAGLALPLAAGCQTGQPGVKTTGIVQYTTIHASTDKATEAAADVLEDLDLQNVESQTTALDGWAKGWMADGTEVKVSLSREADEVTAMSVRVGTLGDSALGREIIARIHDELGLEMMSAAR